MTDTLYLYDTLLDSIRPFQPERPEITMYVCGVTPYDTTHLGHAFTFVSFDMLIRYLRRLGYQVRYIQNVTDIDDPLFERARSTGQPYEELASEQTQRYLDDMRALNVLRADEYPRASREISSIIALIDNLMQSGHAYAVDGHVYFSIVTDASYGELSKLDREQMIEVARRHGGNPDDPLRRDPLDFLLWRPSGAGEPEMASPWGPGLPGWHVECSAMAIKYLGAPVDIHGGGVDLIFPHHESEIAQSEAATGIRPFAHFWVHTGMVYLDGVKMSKSLGNMVFVRDLLRSHGADAIRLYIARCHYRKTLHYDKAALDDAATLARFLVDAANSAPGAVPVSSIDVPVYRRRFTERMNDDLDTPGAIEVLHTLADAIQAERHSGRDDPQARALLRELAGVLGLRLDAAVLSHGEGAHAH